MATLLKLRFDLLFAPGLADFLRCFDDEYDGMIE